MFDINIGSTIHSCAECSGCGFLNLFPPMQVGAFSVYQYGSAVQKTLYSLKCTWDWYSYQFKYWYGLMLRPLAKLGVISGSNFIEHCNKNGKARIYQIRR